MVTPLVSENVSNPKFLGHENAGWVEEVGKRGAGIYKLSEANQALHDLNAGKVKGRAVLIP